MLTFSQIVFVFVPQACLSRSQDTRRCFLFSKNKNYCILVLRTKYALRKARWTCSWVFPEEKILHSTIFLDHVYMKYQENRVFRKWSSYKKYERALCNDISKGDGEQTLTFDVLQSLECSWFVHWRVETFPFFLQKWYVVGNPSNSLNVREHLTDFLAYLRMQIHEIGFSTSFWLLNSTEDNMYLKQRLLHLLDIKNVLH